MNKKISELPAAGALGGVELVEVVKGGVNSQTTTQAIADLGGGGGGTWGSITGTLSSQTDLQAALDAKEDDATQADVTLANGVVALNMAAADFQFLTITEAKVITSITNSFLGTVAFIIPGTNSVTFTTINATITGSYNAGEQNIIWVTCIDATGTPEYTIVYENSLGASGAVETVTGDGVDNTDPLNPVMDLSNYSTQAEAAALVLAGKSLEISRTITDSDTLDIGDRFKLVDANIGTAKTLTVDTGIFSAGDIVYVLRRGAGQLSFTQGAGMTITPSSGGLTDAGANTMVTLYFTSGTTARLFNGTPISLSQSDIENAIGYNLWSAPIIKASDQVFSSTTFADITDLSFAVASAGVYEVKGDFWIDTANSTEGFNLSLTGPTLAAGQLRYRTHNFINGTTLNSRPDDAYEGSGTVHSAALTDGSGQAFFRALFEVTATGTLQMRFATETGGINVTIKKYSMIEWRRLA